MLQIRRLSLLILVLAALAACGASENPDPAKLASEGAAAFDAVSTFHFKLVVSEGQSAPLGDITLITAEGDSLRPDKVSAKLKAQLTGAPIAVNINGIIIGADAWITPNPFNPTQFEQLTDTAGLENFSPAKGVSEVLRGLRSPAFVETSEVEGVKVHHISGVVDAVGLNALTGGVATAGELKLDIWLGVDDKLLRQLVAVGPLDPSEKPGITRTLNLSKFNDPVTIEPPQ
jgi:lipoprotein LprG